VQDFFRKLWAGISAKVDGSARRRDPLTGLLDRDYLGARLTALLADRSAQPAFGVLFIDVNDFKEVNDRFGHIVGDQVLREVAGRLASCMRGADQVVRYGGDEFVVVIERITESSDVAELIGRIHSAMAVPVGGPEGDVKLSMSIGAAMATPEMRSPEDLLAAADRAMYAAKRRET
jgi:diguanylate cyclase (GGDEF)-like protein